MIPKNFFSTLRILHLAICFGTLVVLVAFYFVGKNQTDSPLAQGNQMMVYIFPIMAASVGGMSVFLFKQFLAKTEQAKDLTSKLNQYRVACIVKWALLEGAAIMLALGFFMSKQILFLALGAGVLAFLVIQQADKNTFKTDVKLSSEEQKEFNALFQ